MKSISATMIGIVLVLAAVNIAVATDYIYSSPDYPGTMFTMTYGINDAGELAGYYGDASGGGHGFTLGGTTYSSIDYPGASFTIAYGINNTGIVVGFYEDANGGGHGFTLGGTTYTAIDYPGASFTIAYGINNAGTIVGFYGDASYAYHGFSLSGGTYTSFDYPNASLTIAYGINTAGTIAGSYEDANGVQHGFTLSNGTSASINYPDASFTIAHGINTAGAIVGYYEDATGVGHGFTLNGAAYAPFDVPGASFTIANGINTTGMVAGFYGDVGGGTEAFLAIPDASVVNGACGPANNEVFSSAPAANLCGAGNTASSVSGAGPWSWTCQGTNKGITLNCAAAKAAGTLTIVKNGTGSGTVTSGRTGISCGVTCAAPFPEGFVTLTASPAAASVFTSWEGCTSVYDTSCITDITASTTIIANFTSTDHNVTYNGNTSSGGSVPVDSSTYASGATVTVLGNTSSLVKSNATFSGWNTNANASGTTYSGGATFPMGLADVTLYAIWMAPVRILAGNSYFQTLTEACSAVQNGGTIQATVFSFLPGLNLTRSISFALIGGYDNSFLSHSGVSTLAGPLTISNGTVVVANIVIK
jgi:hypothetical protein